MPFPSTLAVECRARILAVALALPMLVGSPAAAADPACDKRFAQVFNEVAPSVVRIMTVAVDPFSLADRVHLNVGAGIVFDEAGHIVTSAHIVHDANEIMVALDDDDNLRPATGVGIDPISDLAVIRLVDGPPDLAPAPRGRSTNIEIGQEVLAIGYPFGLGRTATRGIISATERVLPLSPLSWLTPLVQTDAAINPGNSGGPLVDRCGAVVAINTMTAPKGQNLSFAVPIDMVMELVPQMIEQGRVIRPWHGVHGRLVPVPLVFALGIPPGLLVETIEPGSPAAKLGLKGGNFPLVIGVEEYLLGGDIIISVNGQPVHDMDKVVAIAKTLRVGDTVTFEYWRDGEIREASVELPERPILAGDIRRFRQLRGQN